MPRQKVELAGLRAVRGMEVRDVVQETQAGGMTEIYQEGLRIPCVRLFREGNLVEDVFEILLLNARLPEERRGDYYAQVAACRLGARRVREIVGMLRGIGGLNNVGPEIFSGEMDALSAEEIGTRCRDAVAWALG
mgnify:CR=1 FL=1